MNEIEWINSERILMPVLWNSLRIKDKEYQEQMREKTVNSFFAGVHNLIRIIKVYN